MKMHNMYHDILDKLGQSMNLPPLTVGSGNFKRHPVIILPTPSWRGWEVVSFWGPGWVAVA